MTAQESCECTCTHRYDQHEGSFFEPCNADGCSCEDFYHYEKCPCGESENAKG